MTGQEAIAYIENYTWSTTRLGLGRTKELLLKLGNPQKKLKFIHVTGSNGKGSTCAILDSVLREAGYCTGLYTSPYIVNFNERIQVNGVSISDSELAEITARVRVVADAMEDHPSQFELVTAIAMLYFYERKCDIVVLEVGMGGALDSTNVIDAPEVAVFANIGLEHTEYLGDTIEKISATKGGIIKPGCSVVAYDGDPRATKVLHDICVNTSVPMTVANFLRMTEIEHKLTGQKLIWEDSTLNNGKPMKFICPLLGKHQQHNLAVALTVLETLLTRGFKVSAEATKRGVAKVSWPARFEVLSRSPLFILDGGHNPQCAEAMAKILDDYLPGTKVTFLMGVLADKDYEKMLDSVCPHAARFICVTPDSPRALSSVDLARTIRKRGIEAFSCEDVPRAILEVQRYREPIIAFGSLYMSGAVLKCFPHRR